MNSLAADEESTLQYMREEEKLARDVYLTLAQKWGTRIFVNIAAAEQNHMDAVKRQIDKYGVEDPVVEDTVGSFTNPELASWYESLVEKGMTSLPDAFEVGQEIEKRDIADLEAAIAKTDEFSLKRVYRNLLRASRRHLRAFERHL